MEISLQEVPRNKMAHHGRGHAIFAIACEAISAMLEA
jgi:hypothetical protein